MIVTHARSRTGRIYPYFVCIGRHQKRTDCTMRAVLIERVEELVEEHYRTIALPAELVDIIEQRLRKDLAAHYAEARAEQERLKKRQERLLKERAKLLEAHYADAIPLDLFKSEQRRIAKELTEIEEVESATRDHQALVETNLQKALRLRPRLLRRLPGSQPSRPAPLQSGALREGLHHRRRQRPQRPGASVQRPPQRRTALCCD
jgi:site-specific DNA recombinase